MPTKLTNKFNLPEVFLKACQVNNHITRGDISTTVLIDAPQVRYLKANHEVTEDVSNMIWMLFGTATHEILERAEINHYQARKMLEVANVLRNFDDEASVKVAAWLRKEAQKRYPTAFESKDLIEKTFSVEVDGLTISGTLDKYIFDEKELNDYKVTGAWSYVYEEAKKKWYAQQNIYAYMLREHGYEVEKANIVALFKDWSKFKMNSSQDYPKSAAMKIEVPLYSQKRVLKYIKGRVEIHKRAEAGDVDPCDGKERWAASEMWAVNAPGRKRALVRCPSEAAADQYMIDNQFKYDSMTVEHRPGEQKRCENFCPVKDVCPQWAELKSKIKKK